MNQARLLDLQDRFINSKSTKYLLRNDQLQRAEEVVGLFAKVRPGQAPQKGAHARARERERERERAANQHV